MTIIIIIYSCSFLHASRNYGYSVINLVEKWNNHKAVCLFPVGIGFPMTTFTDVVMLRYRSGTVNSKSFVGKVFLRIKRKFELTYAL